MSEWHLRSIKAGNALHEAINKFYKPGFDWRAGLARLNGFHEDEIAVLKAAWEYAESRDGHEGAWPPAPDMLK